MSNKKGTFTKTICLPIHLHGIVMRLSEQRKLSSTLAEMLWDRYGEEDISKEEAMIISMKQEKERLEKAIKLKQAEIGRIKPSAEIKKRLTFIEEWKAENSESYRVVKKALKAGQFIINSPNERIKVEAAKLRCETYGSPEEFIQIYEEAVKEAGHLIQLLKNPAEIPEDFTFHNNNNNNNNNNNIYYLINYYYSDSDLQVVR